MFWLRRLCAYSSLALVALVVAVGGRPSVAHAKPPAPRAWVLTLGPGDHPFFKFGHNAIWIEPPGGGGQVYNFGTFAFDSPALIPKFIMGRFYYWLSVASLEETLWVYREANRTIEAQELDLTPAEAHELARRLDENARPANREYLYDYFVDNCSTRVRDAIDGALGGALARALDVPGTQSYRAHALRLTADVPWEYTALDFALSGRTDFAPTRWQESFVPQVFQQALREVKLARPEGEVPLVKREVVLHPAPGRLPPLERPPARTRWFLLSGLFVAAFVYGAARLAHRHRAARVALGGTLALLGGVVGFAGAFLLFVWLATNHTSSQANENLLLAPPWLLALAVWGLGVARGRPRALHRTYGLVRLTLLVSLAGVVLKLLPGFRQETLHFQVFFLPVWLAATVGLKEFRAARNTSSSS